MSDAGTLWAILVAEKHADPSAIRSSEEVRVRDAEQLLARALSVVPSDRTCAVIAEAFEDDWHVLADRLAPLNSFVHPSDEPMLQGVARCLATVAEREPHAIVILIPADHCAAVESAWVSSAKNAVRLGSVKVDTVYILHDKPQNDPRSSRTYPGICSSSVIVGSIQSLIDLCDGKRDTSIVDISVEEDVEQAATNSGVAGNLIPRPLSIVHITSVEEYARLQRGEYGRPLSQVNVHA